MLNLNALPTVSMTGRIANNHLKIHYSNYKHLPYLVLMMYLYDGSSAYLLPVMVFRNNAIQLTKQTVQGDSIHVKAIVTASYYHGFYDTSLVMSGWTFAEKITVAQRQRPLIEKFPFIPENYPKSHVKRTTHHFNQAEQSNHMHHYTHGFQQGMSTTRPKSKTKQKSKTNQKHKKKIKQTNSWHSINVNTKSNKTKTKSQSKFKNKSKHLKKNKNTKQKQSRGADKKSKTAQIPNSDVQIIPPSVASQADTEASQVSERVDSAIDGVIHIKPHVMTKANQKRSKETNQADKQYKRATATDDSFNWMNKMNANMGMNYGNQSKKSKK